MSAILVLEIPVNIASFVSALHAPSQKYRKRVVTTSAHLSDWHFHTSVLVY